MLFLYDVLKTHSAVSVSYTINIQLIALSYKSKDSDYKKELKYIYYDEVTSINYYTYLNNSEFFKEIDNLIILIFQQLLQLFTQSSSISNFKTLFKR